MHPPKTIRLVYPAVSPAAEAYVFALILSTFPVGSVHRLGGWTQTSETPSPLCRQQLEEQRRLLRGLCFNCGGGHWSKDCTSPSRGVEYACPACRQRILITSRGASVESPRAAAAPSAPSRAPPPPPPPTAAVGRSAIAPQRGQKRKREGGACKAGQQVLAMGHRYTALSWHLGNANPPKGACQKARLRCAANAIELDGGHCRSLEQGGYVAAPPAVPRSLTGPRARLGCAWAQTEVEGIRIRRPVDGQLEARLSQVLFRVTDLQTLL